MSRARTIFWWVAYAAASLGFSMPALAAAASASPVADVSVQRAWSRATPPGATVGVVFFELHNAGRADALVGIVTPRARQVEMHASRVVDGGMQMRQTFAVPLPAQSTVSFAPGGLHAMLLGLEQPLRAGESIPLTLTLRSGAQLVIIAVVQDLGATGAPPAAPSPPAAASSPPPSSAAAGGAHDFLLAQWPAHLAAPEFELEDVSGAPRSIADYRGRIVLVFFGFTHCPDICPAGLFKLAQVVKQLGGPPDRVQVVFITLDPRRDVPAELRRYVQAFDPRFVGLTGSAAAVDAAAASFHVEYARVAQGKDYTIDHSTSVFVFDAAGRLRLVGNTTTPTRDFVHDLDRLAER